MPDTRLKILILQEKIPVYRHRLFESITDYADLTLGCVQVPEHAKNASYSIEQISSNPLLNKLFLTSPIQFRNRGFDVVIVMFNLRWPGFLSYLFFNKARVYLWGHARRVSEGSRKPRFLLSKLADGVITYSASEKRFLIDRGWDANKIHALENSVTISSVNTKVEPSNRESLLYVGALEPRKNLQTLIRAYKELAILHEADCPPLIIIGDGSQRAELEALRGELDLHEDIKFLGQITDESVLQEHFESAIAYVSPGATGLGIKHAAGYGAASIINDTFENGPEVDIFIERAACLICDGSEQGIFESLDQCISKPDNLEGVRKKAQEIYTAENFDTMIETMKTIILHT